MVSSHSRAHSFRVTKDFSSFFRGIKPRSRSQFRMERFKRWAAPKVIQEWKIVLRGLDAHDVIFEWPDKKP
jgi:MtN3 and saliva related transmembrane protein